jgi:hypothetical protein
MGDHLGLPYVARRSILQIVDVSQPHLFASKHALTQGRISGFVRFLHLNWGSLAYSICLESPPSSAEAPSPVGLLRSLNRSRSCCASDHKTNQIVRVGDHRRVRRGEGDTGLPDLTVRH